MTTKKQTKRLTSAQVAKMTRAQRLVEIHRLMQVLGDTAAGVRDCAPEFAAAVDAFLLEVACHVQTEYSGSIRQH